MQTIAKELDVIIETGNYTFQLPENYETLLGLTIQSSCLESSADEDAGLTAHTQSDIEQGMELKLIASKVIWNSKQIGDFVRKLGFIDAGKEGSGQITDFKYISKVGGI